MFPCLIRAILILFNIVELLDFRNIKSQWFQKEIPIIYRLEINLYILIILIKFKKQIKLYIKRKKQGKTEYMFFND